MEGCRLASQLLTSNGLQSRSRPAGSQDRRVTWRQGLSSGSSVSHTELRFHNSPPQNCSNPAAPCIVLSKVRVGGSVLLVFTNIFTTDKSINLVHLLNPGPDGKYGIRTVQHMNIHSLSLEKLSFLIFK